MVIVYVHRWLLYKYTSMVVVYVHRWLLYKYTSMVIVYLMTFVVYTPTIHLRLLFTHKLLFISRWMLNVLQCLLSTTTANDVGIDKLCHIFIDIIRFRQRTSLVFTQKNDLVPSYLQYLHEHIVCTRVSLFTRVCHYACVLAPRLALFLVYSYM